MRQSPRFEQIPNRPKKFSLEDTNRIQMIFMQEWRGDPMEWVELYGHAFRTLIEDEPELYDMYRKNLNEFIAHVETELKKRVLH